MIMDLTSLLSNAQAVTATSFSTNILDLGQPGTVYNAGAAPKRDIGKGTRIPFAIRVVQAFNNLTSIVVTMEVADDAAFTTNLTTVFTSPTYALADLQPGARQILPDEIPVGANRRYLRLKYTMAGTAPTVGQITAGVSMGDQTNGNQA